MTKIQKSNCLFVANTYSPKSSWIWYLHKRSEVKVAQLCSTLCDPMQCSPWNSPGQNTGVGSLSFLQRIFPTQGLGSAQYLSPIWASEFLSGMALRLVLASVFTLSIILQTGERGSLPAHFTVGLCAGLSLISVTQAQIRLWQWKVFISSVSAQRVSATYEIMSCLNIT